MLYCALRSCGVNINLKSFTVSYYGLLIHFHSSSHITQQLHTFIIMDKATIDELLASLEAVAASAQGSQSSGNNGGNNSDSARSGEDGSEPPFHIVQLGSHGSATLVPK